MKKPNPDDYVFKDIAKFDTQNPIAGDILKQTQKTDSENLPSIKDTEVWERLDKLRNDRYKNDNRPAPPGITPPTPRPRPPNDDDDNFFNLSSSQPPYNFNSPYTYHQLQILHNYLII